MGEGCVTTGMFAEYLQELFFHETDKHQLVPVSTNPEHKHSLCLGCLKLPIYSVSGTLVFSPFTEACTDYCAFTLGNVLNIFINCDMY